MERMSILDILLLVAGVCVALAVMRPILVVPYDHEGGPIEIVPVTVRFMIVVLGGLSWMGVPLLIWRRIRGGARMTPGQMAWFAHGTASWLLWPPIVVWQTRNSSEVPWSAVCWLWGTPLMGVYMTAALVAGGWFGRGARRRRRRSWHEQLGIVLTCLWACTGFYILYLICKVDL